MQVNQQALIRDNIFIFQASNPGYVDCLNATRIEVELCSRGELINPSLLETNQ